MQRRVRRCHRASLTHRVPERGVSIVSVRCPTIECGANIEVEVLYISARYPWRRPTIPAHVIARVPHTCPQGHALDDTAQSQLEKAAIAERECSWCFEPITESEESFAVKYGRVHERCRSEFNAMMMDEECGPDPS